MNSAPKLPTPAFAEKSPDYLRGGHNIRDIPVDDGIKELCGSLVANGFLQPVGAVDYGDYGEQIYGFRRMAAHRYGVENGLAVPAKVPMLLYPSSLSPTQRRIITATENLQRQDLTDPQTYLLCKELMELNPTWKMMDLAAHLNKDNSMATKYMAPDGLIPEALEAFMAGKFGFSDAYTIKRSPDQLETLGLKLGGATRDQLAASIKRKPVDAQKVPALKMAMRGGTGIVIRGGINLETAREMLEAGLKQVNKAISDGLTAKSAAAFWKDSSKKEKPARRKRAQAS